MKWHLATAVVVLTAGGCSGDENATSKAEATYRKCLAGIGLKLDLYKMLQATDTVHMLCGDAAIDGMKMIFLGATLGDYVLPFDRKSDCGRAREELWKPIDERIIAAYKSDGEATFCAWAKNAIDTESDELFSRFW